MKMFFFKVVAVGVFISFFCIGVFLGIVGPDKLNLIGRIGLIWAGAIITIVIGSIGYLELQLFWRRCFGDLLRKLDSEEFSMNDVLAPATTGFFLGLLGGWFAVIEGLPT